MTAVIDGSNQTTTGLINAGTAVASTSGTIITFTGIPAGVKRVTLMLSGVSTSGTANKLVQIGSGSLATTNYVSTSTNWNGSAGSNVSSTSGFILRSNASADTLASVVTICLASGSSWVSSHSGKNNVSTTLCGGGTVTISGVLDRVAITTDNATDTFTAGIVNIFWE